MTCPDAKTWSLLSMNVLDRDQVESVRRHSMECERCHDTWQEASCQHAELVNAFQAFDNNHDQRRDQLMAMLPQVAPDPQKESGIPPWRQWLGEGGIAMTLRQHKTRWAAVASVTAACIVLVFFLMASEKVALAEVLQRMRQAKTMVCDVVSRLDITEQDPRAQSPGMETPRRSKLSMYFDGNTRAVLNESERPEFTVVVTTAGTLKDNQEAEKAKAQAAKAAAQAAKGVKTIKCRTLMLADKAYIWEGDQVRVLTPLDPNRLWTAEDWLNQLLEVREAPDRNLGEKMIHGRRAVGFEITSWKPSGDGSTAGSLLAAEQESLIRVWVDVEQDLPIRIEIEQPLVMSHMKGTMHLLFDKVQWNVPLDEASFQPPSNEELAQAETVRLPATDEASFVELMQAWVDSNDKAKAAIDLVQKKAEEKRDAVPGVMDSFSGGAALGTGYPEKLDMHWLSSAFSARLVLAHMAETLPTFKPIPDDVDQEERARLSEARAKQSARSAAQASEQAQLKALAAAAFYAKLANEQRDPQYFGATVKPGDSKAVLLKWKLDDSRYRVIYGDLHAESVDSTD